MNLIFIHGWSVTNTDTYGELPAILAEHALDQGIALNIVDIHLGRYISFHDEVRMDDVVRALQKALMDTLPNGNGSIQSFACITHSTGGPVARSWVNRYFGSSNLPDCPMRQLIMLAPANHGSALAILGSERVGRIKSIFNGIEPGDGILKWLELGSEESRSLNHDWLTCDPLIANSKFRPFVLIGETIDKKFYDFINSYLAEVGSDGVVRVAAASIHYRWISFDESDDTVEMSEVEDDKGNSLNANLLHYKGNMSESKPCPFLVVSDAAHSGDKIGIMRSPTLANANDKPVVAAILQALSIKSKKAYEQLKNDWAQSTETLQNMGKRKRFFQMIVQVKDNEGYPVTDYDLILLAGTGYSANKLPDKFFVDKQRNKRSPQIITFYLDFDIMMGIDDKKFGFRIVGRPSKGFGYYHPVEFRSDAKTIDHFVDPNSTLYIDVTLKRHVDEQTMRLDPATDGAQSFKKTKPDGIEV